MQDKNMKSKKKVDIGTLVDLVVNTARSDTTSPDPKNPRVGWQTDQLLIGTIDKLMTYQRNDPAAYAEIGRRVSAQVSDLPEIVVLAQLAVFRGERLLPVNAKRKSKLSAIIAELEVNINSLTAGSRKERCRSLFAYHQGVFYDAYEMFAQAAKLQGQSAEIAQANGDKPGEAIGYFLEAVYQLKDALCQPSLDEEEAVFSIMEERYVKLVEAVRGTPLEVSWGQGNASAHMLEACIWLGLAHPKWDCWVSNVTSAAPKLGDAWKLITDFIRAVDLHQHGDINALNALETIADGNENNEIRATSLLILTRVTLSAGQLSETRKVLRRMPKTGVRHIRAVAERLLA